MKKTVISALLAAALVAPLANATMVSQWTVGTWTRFNLSPIVIPGPLPGDPPVAIPGVNPGCDNSNPNGMNCISDQSLRWGEPTGAGGKSGLDITNGGSSGSPYLSTPVYTNGLGADNVVITHYNQPIYAPSLDSVTILSTLYLTPVTPAGSTVGPIGPVTFAINFEETDNGANPCANGQANNQGVNINGCADIFVIDKQALNFAFQFTDPDDLSPTPVVRTYYLSFFERTGGFQPLQGPAGDLDAPCAAAGASYPCLGFMTPEGQNTPAQFAVTITSQPITIPEPGTLALLGIALTGLGLVRRRRNI